MKSKTIITFFIFILISLSTEKVSAIDIYISKATNDETHYNELRFSLISPSGLEENLDKLIPGQFSTYPDDLSVNIGVNAEYSFPESMAYRFMRLLHKGWNEELTCFRDDAIKREGKIFDEKLFSCFCIMLYLSLNIKNFLHIPEELDFKTTNFHESISSFLANHDLLIGDIVIIRNKIHDSNNTVMYLGNDIFLYWSFGGSYFQFKTTQQLERSSPKISYISILKTVRYRKTLIAPLYFLNCPVSEGLGFCPKY